MGNSLAFILFKETHSSTGKIAKDLGFFLKNVQLYLDDCTYEYLKYADIFFQLNILCTVEDYYVRRQQEGTFDLLITQLAFWLKGRFTKRKKSAISTSYPSVFTYLNRGYFMLTFLSNAPLRRRRLRDGKRTNQFILFGLDPD